MEQDDNALFYQILDELGLKKPTGKQTVDALADVIFFMDFAGIFDKNSTQKKYTDRQKKAESMFRPAGVTLDFGSGPCRYLAFERSASVSGRSMLSFIRADLYEPIRRRIMLDMVVGKCQLSKLYAYNGLMMSSGDRVDGTGIDKSHRCIVIDNPVYKTDGVNVITVEDDGSTGNVRTYHRVEKRIDNYTVMGFDGEGMVSKQYAEVLNKALGKKKHTSFQIRMPYVKGMLHQVDFKDFLKSAGTTTITDIWGQVHDVEDVDIPIFHLDTKGAWTLRFDDVIADALLLGPLKNYEVTIPEEILVRKNNTGTCLFSISENFRL